MCSHVIIHIHYTHLHSIPEIAVVDCSASSQFDYRYACENVFDKDTRAVTNEWASLFDGDNAWIRLDLGQDVTVAVIALLQRCHFGDQGDQVAASFSGGEVILVSNNLLLVIE